ncbi:MAG: DEAD/DEAH box helicase family protein, partial [Gammaproteobacteria bacterium]|nr:DEAD/DEAH box helicase family protein [Gammaproteobacteria bacterium]
VINSIWDIVRKLGFESGRVLEPGMGVGHFYGLMPSEMRSNSQLHGIELDAITGRIAQQLYPSADISVTGYQNKTLPNDFFDVVVGNVPFADVKPYDPTHNKERFSLHDYYFNKSLNLTKPGGLVVFITSRYTMDKQSDRVRTALAKKADFVGAIRLPNTAFKQNANTEVTTDIIILRKRKEGAASIFPAFTSVETVQLRNKDNEKIDASINEYFVGNPKMVAGRLAATGTMYGGNEPTVEPTGDLATQLKQIVLHELPEKIRFDVEKQDSPADRDEDDTNYNNRGVKEGAYYVDGDELYQVVDGVGKVVKKKLGNKGKDGLSKLDHGRVKGLSKIRDAIRKALKAQMDGLTDAEKDAARKELHDVYDAFVDEFGIVNDTKVTEINRKDGKTIFQRRTKNLKPFLDDPDAYLVAAIEDYDDVKNTAGKGAIFHEDVLRPERSVEDVETVHDALLASLSMRNKVDIPYIAELYKKSEQDVIEELRGKIYNDPESGQWITDDAYLSGNVKHKLQVAEKAAKEKPEFEANVKALEEIQPEDIPPSGIVARLGANWIKADYYKDFLRSLLGDVNINISYIEREARWVIDGWTRDLAATAEWGTDDYDAVSLFAKGMNSQTPEVRRRNSDGTTYKDVTATLNAQDKLQKIKDRFVEWIWEDSARADALGRTYNDKFNNIVTRKLDGSHLTFPGMKAIVPNGWFQGLRPHQKNGAWRVMQQGNTLLGHVVGSGKTITMVAAGMEMKRVGLINKPMYVVPNHMLKQFSTELLDLYPNAKILVADERQFHSSKRKQFVNKVATNNWDAVIITHSAFGKIPISEQREAASIENEILEYNALIVDAKADGDRNIIKNLEKSKQRLKERLLTLSNRKSKDAGVTFEETGIDFMFVDEAHEFKNLEVKTKMGNVKNLPTTGSQKAWDLYTKIGYLNEINARRAVVFATGTPVSNSMVEMYTMQRYLSPELLSEQGIEHFDAWAANYGDKVTTAEIDPTGGSYRMDTRFAKFTNVPELIATFHEVADIQLAEDLNLPTPKLKTGEAQVIEAKASDVQKHFVTSLKNRLDEIKGKKVEKGGDNALKIVGEGRHAALDMRTLDPDARDHPGSKVNLCVDRLIDIHRKTAKERLTQMVFCDLNTPGKGGFSVYDDIKTKLIKSGIPASEIAFIHDANTAVKKERLFADVRAGKVRVLIGSTAKMGVGTNVQKRLVAMHHLDAPWRPSDIEQRDGRILRQGNENEEVEIFRYVTSGTFDAYMWQTLEVKQKFISQIMKGDRSIREMDDLDEGGALNAAQVKAIATGNPMILEAVGLESDINRLKRLRNAHKDEQFRFKRGVRQANDDIMWADENITEYEELIKIRDANTGEKFSIIVDGKVYDKRKDAGKQIISQISQALEKKEWNKKRTVGEFRGAAIVIEAEKLGKTLSVANVTLKIKNNEYSLREVFDEKSDAVGLIRQIDNRLNSFESRLESEKERREDANKSIPGLEARIGKPFAKEDELAEKEVRHADIVAQLSDTAETTDDVQEQRGSALARADGKWNAEAVEILSKAVEGVSVRYVADGEIQQGESKKGQPQGQPVLGYYDSANNEIVINRDRATKDTIFHEFAHPVINYVRENDKKLYEQGMSLIRGSEYANSEEGLVQAIGEKGAKIQDDVKRNKFVAWLKRVWMKAKIAFKKAFGFEMSLDEFTDMMALSMRSGIPLTPFTKGGRKTLVKPQGQKQTGTAAFRKWFGKSKVVDEKGEPLVVYHGTNRDFNIFGDGNNNNVERGVHYFTENSKISGEYAITAKPHAEQNIESQIKEVDRKAHAAYENKDWDIHSKYYKQKVRLEAELVYNIRPHNKRGEGANVISVYLSIERPFKINADGNFWQNMNSTIKEAKGKGYDGIYVQNVDDPAHIILAGRPHNVWIAFAPTQIKSATGNRGTFDAENADIQYQFAGKRAKTADETLLQQAETMLKNDFDADTVREQTGWFVNPFDKKWRFEIDDRKLEFKGRKNWVRLFDGNEMQLRDLIDHDALFKAYPELMDTKVMLTAISGDKGGFVNDQGEMGIGSGAVEDIAFHMNTVDASRLILHEVQHLIQRIEGFAQGGSPGQFILEDIAEAEKHARKRMDKINSEIRVLNKGENSLRELQQLTDLNKELNELRDVTADMITMSRSDAHARYTNLAGEYESRDVEARADYDEFQRLGVAPFSSEPQITEDNVIVTYDGGGGASFKLGDEKTPYPDVPSAYEKGKDDWFGEKDWKRRQASNEANKLQKRIQNTIRKKPSRFKEPLRLKWEKEWLDVDRAIHIYIDMKRNPDHLEEFYDDLTDEQKRIVDIAQNLSEDQIAIADDIASSYKETGFEALEEGVIRNVLDNYAARTWDLDGKSTDEYWRKFGTTTRHARRRVLETILEGWANGYELKIEGATNNLATLKAEIANVIEDKKLVKECMKIETDDGEKLFSFKNMSGYRQIEHPNFTWWGYAGTIKSNPEAVLEAENSRDLVITPEGTILRRKAIFAPEKIAKKLNRVLGASKIGHIGWVNFLTKYNAVIKATILQTSLFHHIAFTNSYLFGSAISRPSDLNIFGAYKKGLQAIEDAGPHIELLVRNGLTIGNIQDWEENLLREKTAVGRMLDKMAVTKAIKDKIIMFQEKQARLLFQRYGAGLKAFTALLEYKRLLRTMPELEPNQRAKIVADMTNADFGGLHLQRMGRDQTTQHIFRLFALAPDWTESNIRSMVKAVKAGSKEERHVYQTLWGRVATRGLLLTTAANLLLAMWDGDDDDEKYIDSVKRRYKKAWDKGYLKWLDVDISPIYRAMGGDDDHTAYFSLIGHFKDPVKFLTSPKTAAHHKGSVIYRMIFEAIVMKNWRGSPFTTWDELLGVDDKGRYKSSSRKHGYKKGDPKGGKLKGQLTKSKYLETKTGDFEQIPSYLLHQTRQSSAIQIQNAIGYLTGEIEGFEAIAKSAGLKVNVSKNYPKKEVKPKGKRLVRRKRTMVRRTSP